MPLLLTKRWSKQQGRKQTAMLSWLKPLIASSLPSRQASEKNIRPRPVTFLWLTSPPASVSRLEDEIGCCYPLHKPEGSESVLQSSKGTHRVPFKIPF